MPRKKLGWMDNVNDNDITLSGEAINEKMYEFIRKVIRRFYNDIRVQLSTRMINN